MSEWLDGIKQGGKLGVVADLIVADGAVTALSTDAISLRNDSYYRFSGVIKSSSTCIVEIQNNGNATGTNYERAAIGSNSASENIANPCAIACTGATVVHYHGSIMVNDGVCTVEKSSYDQTDPVNGWVMQVHRYKVVEDTVGFTLQSDTASTIGNGSTFKIVKVY